MIVKSNTNLFQLQIPANWTAEEGDELLSIYASEEGVGALQISCYRVSPGTPVDLKEVLIEQVEDKVSVIKSDLVKLIEKRENSVLIQLIDDDSFWRYQLIFQHGVVLLVTYNCAQEDKNVESTEVEAIINSILINA